MSKKKQITKSPKLTAGTKIRIKNLLKNFKPKEVAEAVGCTIHQVNAVKYGKVKMKNESRVDKGIKRNSVPIEELETVLDENDSTEDILQKVIKASLFQLTQTNMAVDKKIFLADKCSRINKNLADLKLFKHMKVANAELIVRMMRRIDKSLSTEDIKKIYHEELLILKKMKNKAEA